MLTKEQIDNLKEGDTLLLAVILEKKITHGSFKVKTDKDSCVTASTIRLSLPSEYKTVVDARDIFHNMSEGEKVCIDNFLCSYFRETKKQEEMRNSLKKMGIDLTNIRPKHDPCRLFKKGDIVRYVERDGRSYVDAPPVGATCRVCGGEDRVGMVCIEFKFSENEESARHEVPFYYLELVTPVEKLEPYSVVDAHTHWDVAVKDMKTIASYSKVHHPNAKEAAEAERDRLNTKYRKEQI